MEGRSIEVKCKECGVIRPISEDSLHNPYNFTCDRCEDMAWLKDERDEEKKKYDPNYVTKKKKKKKKR